MIMIYLFIFGVAAFVTKLVLREALLLENVNTSPKPKASRSIDDEEVPEYSAIHVEDEGMKLAFFFSFNLF